MTGLELEELKLGYAATENFEVSLNLLLLQFQRGEKRETRHIEV